MRLGSTKERRQAPAGDRGHRPAEALHLGDHSCQGSTDDLAEVLWVQLVAQRRRARHFGEEHAHDLALLPKARRARGRCLEGGSGDPGRSGLEDRFGVNLVQRRGDPKAQLFQGDAAAVVGAHHQMALPLGRIGPHQCRGCLLESWVVAQAGLPGLHDRLGPGTACSSGAVACQSEARLLAEGLQALPGPQRPLGVGLVGKQILLVCQSGHKTIVTALAWAYGQRGPERLFVGLQVDVDRSFRRGPDMAQVGLKEAGRRLAELGEDTPGQ